MRRLPRDLLSKIREIGLAAARQGMAAYLVGGPVRDLLLNRPVKDCDIVVESGTQSDIKKSERSGQDALGLAQILARRFRSAVKTYGPFKTATLIWPDQRRIDLATARSEVYPRPGALPEVKPGSLRDDLFRRDFTINALAISLHPDSWGRLMDEWGGGDDLARKTIRVMHPNSFIDDPTRLLRAVRFEQRLGFHWELATQRLWKDAVMTRQFSTVSSMRYFAEFKKILAEAHPQRCLKRLQDLGGLQFFPYQLQFSLRFLSHVERQVTALKRHRRHPLYGGYDRWWLVYWLALLEKANERQRRQMIDRFSFTHKEQKAILEANEARVVMSRLDLARMKRSQVYRCLHRLSPDVVIFLRAAAASARIRQRIDRYWRTDRDLPLAINGHDMKELGLSGPRIKEALEALRDAVMDGLKQNRTAQQRWVREKIGDTHLFRSKK